MRDIIVLSWVAFVLAAAIFLAIASIIHLFQNKKIKFDKGFLYSLSACLVALILCLSIWPPVHRVYEDEFTFISQSVNILGVGKANIITEGSRLHPENFSLWATNPKLPGYALLESVVLFFTKDFEHSYFILNIILGTLSVAVMYRIAWLLTSSQAVAWWSAIFLACLPVRISYSMSAASDISGLFFFLLLLLFLGEYRLLKSKRILYAALFCGIYSICIKPFYAVFVIVTLSLVLYIYRRDGHIDKKICSQLLLDAICLFLPILGAIPVFIFSDSMAGGYSFSFMYNNLCTSISYLFNCKQMTVLTILFLLVAVVRSVFYQKNRLVNWLAGWFFLWLLIFSVFYSGGISYPGHAYSDRYFLFLAFPFVFLAASGVVDLLGQFKLRIWGSLFFVILILSSFFASRMLDYRVKDGFYSKKTFLLKQVSSYVPDDAYVVDESPVLITAIMPKRSIHMDLFLNGIYPKRVVILKGLSDALYTTDFPNEQLRLGNVLRIKYHCQALTAAPLTKAYLSVTPILCTQK